MSLVSSLLGTTPGFYFKGRSRKFFKKAWLVLIIFLLFLLGSAVFLGRDLFLRENPIVRRSEQIDDDPGEFFFHPNEFNMGFGVTFEDGVRMDESIAKGYFQSFFYKPLEVGGEPEFGEFSLPTEPCTSNHFGSASVNLKESSLS